MIPWYWAPLCATLGLSGGVLAGIWLSGVVDEPPAEPEPAEEPLTFEPWWRNYQNHG